MHEIGTGVNCLSCMVRKVSLTERLGGFCEILLVKGPVPVPYLEVW